MLNLELDPQGLAAALRHEKVLLRRPGQPDIETAIMEAVGYTRAQNSRYGSILTADPGHVATGYSRTQVLLVACHDPDGKPGGCVHLKQLRIGSELLGGSTAICVHLGLTKATTGTLREENGRIVLSLSA